MVWMSFSSSSGSRNWSTSPGGLGPAYCGNSLSLVGNYRVKLERSLAALVKTVHPSSRTGGGAGL